MLYKHTPGNSWPEATKLEAVKSWLILGSAPLVSAVTGVSPEVIRQWRMKPWWKEYESELKSEDEIKLSGRLKKIASKSLDEVEDRLANGEFVFNQKTGNLERRPVQLKDVHKIAVDLIDKTRLIEGKPTSRTENVQQVSDQLRVLAEEFAKFANGGKTPKVIDVESVEVVDAIHEERPPGLREGDEVATEKGQQ